jgi:hypothetical protein
MYIDQVLGGNKEIITQKEYISFHHYVSFVATEEYINVYFLRCVK